MALTVSYPQILGDSQPVEQYAPLGSEMKVSCTGFDADVRYKVCGRRLLSDGVESDDQVNR